MYVSHLEVLECEELYNKLNKFLIFHDQSFIIHTEQFCVVNIRCEECGFDCEFTTTGNVEKVVFEAIGEKPVSVQGLRTGVWAIVDYFDIVVHVFHKDARSRFALEELWGDANITKHEYAGDELINNAEV